MKSSRRDFLKLTGCLTIGFTIGDRSFGYASPLVQELPQSLKRHPRINAWLEVLADGRIRIFTGKMELGQGIRTAIAQVAAEELYMDVNRVEIKLAETGVTPDEGYTAGSGSIEQSAMAVRYAAAAARQKLLSLAAGILHTDVQALKLANGKVYSKKRALDFHELLGGKQLTDEVRAPVTLKPKKDYRLVGKAIPRSDIRMMVSAKNDYIQDLRFPGMVHARVLRPPAYDAKLQSFDEAYVRDRTDGLISIVRNGDFLAVIAEDEYQAIKAQKLLRESARWSAGKPLPPDEPAKLQEYLTGLPLKTEMVEDKGIVSAKNPDHRARYFKPYIMHASIGPSCALALWTDGRLSVWSHSQGVYPLRDSLANMLSMPAENIHITGVPGSGCYGHNGADDAAADVALIARSLPGRHVRLQWSREDEHAWEPYGSAMIMEASATLDPQGKISSWKYSLWSDTHSTRPGGEAENLLAARYMEKPFGLPGEGYSGGAYRNAQPYYIVPNIRVDAHFFRAPLRVSALRSLGAYANIFAIESFMDELAEKAGRDPFEFRLLHLNDDRAKAVIHKLREMSAGHKKSDGYGLGIAFSRYKNHASYCAVASLVRVNNDERTVKVEKMWAVIDSGETINIDGVKNQTQGGMIQAASWTLLERVRFDERHITSTDWGTYPIMRFGDAPQTVVEVINRPEEEPLGAGEAAQGPAAASIANAVYQACGKRIRELPLIEHLFPDPAK